jgi:hypothetical protein
VTKQAVWVVAITLKPDRKTRMQRRGRVVSFRRSFCCSAFLSPLVCFGRETLLVQLNQTRRRLFSSFSLPPIFDSSSRLAWSTPRPPFGELASGCARTRRG